MVNAKSPKAGYSEIMYGYKNHVEQSIQSSLVHQYPREQSCTLPLKSEINTTPYLLNANAQIANGCTQINMDETNEDGQWFVFYKHPSDDEPV